MTFCAGCIRLPNRSSLTNWGCENCNATKYLQAENGQEFLSERCS